MGWRFKWVSSHSNDFNYDYHVSYTNNEIAAGKVYYNYALSDFVCEELSGNSVFYKDAAGNVFHTYSTHGRGDEMLVGAYMYLDLTPKGRNETGPHYIWAVGCGTMIATTPVAPSTTKADTSAQRKRIPRAGAARATTKSITMSCGPEPDHR